MRIHLVGLAAAVLSLGVWGCGSSGYTSGPSTPSSIPGTAVIINVVPIDRLRIAPMVGVGIKQLQWCAEGESVPTDHVEALAGRVRYGIVEI